MGATRGGGTFTATPTMRSIEADGKRYEFKGSTVIDTWDIKLTATLMEITPDNFVLALGTAEKTEDKSFTVGKKTTIKLRTNIEDGDYIQNLVWFGNTSKGFVAIALECTEQHGCDADFQRQRRGHNPGRVPRIPRHRGEQRIRALRDLLLRRSGAVTIRRGLCLRRFSFLR